jgi:hypothetical protein
MAPDADRDHAFKILSVRPERGRMTAETMKRKIRNFPAATLQERISR